MWIIQCVGVQSSTSLTFSTEIFSAPPAETSAPGRGCRSRSIGSVVKPAGSSRHAPHTAPGAVHQYYAGARLACRAVLDHSRPSCAKEGIAGQLSAAPYGFAGSVAASRVTVNVPYTCSVSVRCGVWCSHPKLCGPAGTLRLSAVERSRSTVAGRRPRPNPQ